MYLITLTRKADERRLGRILVETVTLLSIHNQTDTAKALHKVDVDEITKQVKPEFAAKEKAKAEQKATPKPQAKTAKKSAAPQNSNQQQHSAESARSAPHFYARCPSARPRSMLR